MKNSRINIIKHIEAQEGKNKGTVKNISATEHKQQFIRDNNIYYWTK